jgi:hypothetical protein
MALAWVSESGEGKTALSEANYRPARDPAAWVGVTMKSKRTLDRPRSEADLCKRVFNLGGVWSRSTLGGLMRLTKRQRQLIEDIELLAAPLRIDPTLLPIDTQGRTDQLLVVFHQWVRGQVVMRYTLIDEYLGNIIANYYFRKRKAGHYRRLWKTKKFQLFCHYVLDELYLPKKRDLVEAIEPLPTGIGGKIMKINDLRNALAHSFFPQNRRRYYNRGTLLYEGQDFFTKAGVEKFWSDADEVINAVSARADNP